MRTSTLYIIVACLGAAFILTLLILRADHDGLRLINQWVNFGGSALTFFGLVWAYLRADPRIGDWLRRVVQQLRGPRTRAIDSSLTVTASTSAGLLAIYGFPADSDDPIATLRARTDKLLYVVNRLSAELTDAETRIGELQAGIEAVRTEAREGDEQTREHAAAQLRQFSDALNDVQALDLRWAIAGVFFQTFGAVMAVFS